MDATAPEKATQSANTVFRCGKCRTAHPWAAEHAGKTARCTCGQVLKVPTYPEGGKPAAPTPKKKVAPKPVPAAPAAVDENGVPAFLRMTNAPAPEDDKLDVGTEAELAALSEYGATEGVAAPDPKRDLHIPAAMLAAGAIVTFIDMHVSGVPGVFALIGTIMKIGFYSVLFLAGALLAAKMFGIYLGRLGPALLKLAAVSVTPAAVGDLVTTMLGGDAAVACLGGAVAILTCWGSVSYLFRLELDKTLTVVGSIAFVKLIVWMLFGGLIMLAVSSITPSHGSRAVDADDPGVAETDAALVDFPTD